MVGQTCTVTPLENGIRACAHHARPGAPRERRVPCWPCSRPSPLEAAGQRRRHSPAQSRVPRAALPFSALPELRWGGRGGEVCFQLPHWSGTDFVVGFFFSLFLFFPKRGEKELGKGSWPAVGGRGFSWESGAAPVKPALGGPLEKCLVGGASSRPSPSQNAGVSMTFLAGEPEHLLMPMPRSRRQMPSG